MPSHLQDYTVLGTIGSGSYGTCKKIRRKKDGKVLVWKELDYGRMSEMEKQMLVSEVNLLRELKHPHIVRYYDRIIDRTNTTIYIVMEYCEGGDLSALISKHKTEKRFVSEEYVWKIMYQLVLAVQECHRRKNGGHVLHRDLKPANVFLDVDQNVKLGDFGLARVLVHDTSFAQTFVGTPYYMSPEQVNKMSYNEKSDIWSLGCLLYELCALSPPFTAMNQRSLEAKIKIGRFHPIPSGHFSSSLNKVISSMLEVNQNLRPSIDELLQNPHFSKLQRETRNVNSSDKEESLRRWEKTLNEKEKELERKEKDLTHREKILEEREDRLSRMEVESGPSNYRENVPFKRGNPNYFGNYNYLTDKENDTGYIKRRFTHDDDVFARPLVPSHKLHDIGYRHGNAGTGNVRFSRLYSGLR